MNASRIGTDLTNATFLLHGIDPNKKVALRQNGGVTKCSASLANCYLA
jgi:hypothetical protein